MEIVVQLRSDLAELVNRPGSSLRSAAVGHMELQRIADLLMDFDAGLLPQHPGITDTQLQSYFVVPCGQRDVAACECIAAMLRQNAAVQVAYLKLDAKPAAPREASQRG